MAATSRDANADATLLAANATVQRRAHARGVTFTGVRHALQWWGEARGRMQAPNGLHPKTVGVGQGGGYRGDEQVLLQVDGGRGGDIDDVLATLQSVQAGIDRARAEHPRGTEALIQTVVYGKSQASLADAWKLDQGTLSRQIGLAENYLKGFLAAGLVLR